MPVRRSQNRDSGDEDGISCTFTFTRAQIIGFTLITVGLLMIGTSVAILLSNVPTKGSSAKGIGLQSIPFLANLQRSLSLRSKAVAAVTEGIEYSSILFRDGQCLIKPSVSLLAPPDSQVAPISLLQRPKDQKSQSSSDQAKAINHQSEGINEWDKSGAFHAEVWASILNFHADLVGMHSQHFQAAGCAMWTPKHIELLQIGLGAANRSQLMQSMGSALGGEVEVFAQWSHVVAATFVVDYKKSGLVVDAFLPSDVVSTSSTVTAIVQLPSVDPMIRSRKNADSNSRPVVLSLIPGPLLFGHTPALPEQEILRKLVFPHGEEGLEAKIRKELNAKKNKAENGDAKTSNQGSLEKNDLLEQSLMELKIQHRLAIAQAAVATCTFASKDTSIFGGDSQQNNKKSAETTGAVVQNAVGMMHALFPFSSQASTRMSNWLSTKLAPGYNWPDPPAKICPMCFKHLDFSVPSTVSKVFMLHVRRRGCKALLALLAHEKLRLKQDSEYLSKRSFNDEPKSQPSTANELQKFEESVLKGKMKEEWNAWKETAKNFDVSPSDATMAFLSVPEEDVVQSCPKAGYTPVNAIMQMPVYVRTDEVFLQALESVRALQVMREIVDNDELIARVLSMLSMQTVISSGKQGSGTRSEDIQPDKMSRINLGMFAAKHFLKVAFDDKYAHQFRPRQIKSKVPLNKGPSGKQSSKHMGSDADHFTIIASDLSSILDVGAFYDIPDVLVYAIVKLITKSESRCMQRMSDSKWCQHFKDQPTFLSSLPTQKAAEVIMDPSNPDSLASAISSLLQSQSSSTPTLGDISSACGLDNGFYQRMKDDLNPWEVEAWSFAADLTSGNSRKWSSVEISLSDDSNGVGMLALAVFMKIAHRKQFKMHLVLSEVSEFSRTSRILDALDVSGAMTLVNNVYGSNTLLLGLAAERAASRHGMPTQGSKEEFVSSAMQSGLSLSELVQNMHVLARQACRRTVWNSRVSLGGELKFWQRQEEYLETLQWNACNADLRSITQMLNNYEDSEVFTSTLFNIDDPCERRKLALPSDFKSDADISTSLQPKYSDIWGYGQSRFTGQVVLALNGDIALQHTGKMAKITPNELWGKIVLFSRQEFTERTLDDQHNNHHSCCSTDNYDGCTDGFMVMLPIEPRLLLDTNFFQNVWGAENLLMWVFEKYGYSVINPCLQFRSIHNHESDFRPNQHQERINNLVQNSACCPSDDLATGGCHSCSCSHCGGLTKQFLAARTRRLRSTDVLPDFLQNLKAPASFPWNDVKVEKDLTKLKPMLNINLQFKREIEAKARAAKQNRAAGSSDSTTSSSSESAAHMERQMEQQEKFEAEVDEYTELNPDDFLVDDDGEIVITAEGAMQTVIEARQKLQQQGKKIVGGGRADYGAQSRKVGKSKGSDASESKSEKQPSSSSSKSKNERIAEALKKRANAQAAKASSAKQSSKSSDQNAKASSAKQSSKSSDESAT